MLTPPLRMSAKKKKVPQPSGDGPGRPSASPADANAAAEAAAKAKNREGWRDGLMKHGAQLLGGLLPMVQWRKQLDLAELAVKIAQTRDGATPRDCLREASELMLATKGEFYWIEEGRGEEMREAANAEASEGLDRALVASEDEYVKKRFAQLKKDNPAMSDFAEWNLFCQEAGNPPALFTFPDGLEWEPVRSEAELAEMVRAFLEKRDAAENTEPFLDEAKAGKAEMGELYMLATDRNEQRWNDKVPWGMLCYQDSNVAPDPLKLPDGSTFQAFARFNRFKELVTAYFEELRIAERVHQEVSDANLKEYLERAKAGNLIKVNVRGLAEFRAKGSKKHLVKSGADNSSAPDS